MATDRVEAIVKILEEIYPKLQAPVKALSKVARKDPFSVLICTVVSTRTRDVTTAKVCRGLLARVKGPEDLIKLSEEELSRLLYPAGFYREKAKNLRLLAQKLLKDHQGRVPTNRAELLKLPGVGKKVANLVLSQAYGLPYIGVDTHVHRICNRLGLVKTKRAEDTEKLLHEIVPDRLKVRLNGLLVALGQTLCLPRNPKCQSCPLAKLCGFAQRSLASK